LVSLHASWVFCSHNGCVSPTLIQENLAYFRQIEQRARLWLHAYQPDERGVMDAAKLIGYPASEALANVGPDVDRHYHGWVHEQNVQAVVDWLLANSAG
jgi:hypothetical protein